jgi:hypothetical protein
MDEIGMGHVETCPALNLCKNLFFKRPVFIGNTFSHMTAAGQKNFTIILIKMRQGEIATRVHP